MADQLTAALECLARDLEIARDALQAVLGEGQGSA